MAFEIENFQDAKLDIDFLNFLVDGQSFEAASRLGRFWNYFRNSLAPVSGITADKMNGNSRPYLQAQEVGLPARITGVQRSASGTETMTDLTRKEVVIENDIAWRIHTMVDFLFGKGVTIRSTCEDENRGRAIESILNAMFDANGAAGFFQEISLLGSVYGFVDIAFRHPAVTASVRHTSTTNIASGSVAVPSGAATDKPGTPNKNVNASAARGGNGQRSPEGNMFKLSVERAEAIARKIVLETIEAPRVLPILAEDDYRQLRYWIQRFNKYPARMSSESDSWFRLPWRRGSAGSAASVEVIEITGSAWWQRYENRKLVGEGPNVPQRVPVVHIQNLPLVGSYEGISDVEGLIPLQDELNTRLSDRASRVTYQSFKMYLGKGIDDFLERPVGPGQMWATQNLDADISEFGSDDGSPSEDMHIEQIRQALDKTSSVTPLAAGLIGGNIGNLTSAAALKVVMSGLLARTERKRITYGHGIKRIAEMALEWMDSTGIFKTTSAERKIEIDWPDMLPVNEHERLINEKLKMEIDTAKANRNEQENSGKGEGI